MGLLVYIFIMLITMYVMIMYTEPMFFFVCIAEILILIVCFIMSCVIKQRIRIRIIYENITVSSGHPVPLVFEVENKSIFPVDGLKIQCQYWNVLGDCQDNRHRKKKQWIQVYVNSKTTAKIKMHLESDYCGILKLCLKQFKVTDFLHIFSFRKKLNLSYETTVFPDETDVHFEITPAVREFVGESDTFSQEHSGDDPSEVFDIRPYRMGDRLQKIHWKMSARMDEYMVKEFSKPLGCPVVVFLDLSKNKMEEKNDIQQLDHLIKVGVSISKGLIEADCRHFLAWCDEHLTIQRACIENYEDIYAVIISLMHLKIHDSIDDPRKFYGQKYGFDSFYTILSVNLESKILKDGELYEDTKGEWDSFSGKNFIL